MGAKRKLRRDVIGTKLQVLVTREEAAALRRAAAQAGQTLSAWARACLTAAATSVALHKELDANMRRATREFMGKG